MSSKPSSAHVVVADDDETVRRLLERHLARAKFDVATAEDGTEAIAILGAETDVALLDLEMPGASGLEVLKHIKGEHPETSVIMLSAKGQIADAVEAMKGGAIDYLTKPIDMDNVVAAVSRGVKLSQLAKENRDLKDAVGGEQPRTAFIGKSDAVRKILSDIEKIAPLDSTVLITGPSGCGKTLIARQIHYASLRSDEPFVSVSCPALPRDLLESELFGHEKGAFTGASSRRIGKFELASGGTIFLDEIGELPLDLQPKLLNVLQDRQLFRVGGEEALEVDVRVIAATNCNLEEAVASGSFREDLYYRLNVIPIHLPPLNERRDDIPLLARTILDRIGRDRNRKPLELDADAEGALRSFNWPGNVRQLENFLERASAFATGDRLTTETLPAELSRNALAPQSPTEDAGGATQQASSLAGIPLADLERRAIEQTLDRCGGNQAEAARQLGVSERTIYNKLKKFDRA